MRKLLLPALISAASLTIATTALADGPVDGKVYGKINLTVQSEDVNFATGKKDETWKLANNPSRLGFAGESKLDGMAGTNVLYQLEYEVAPDSGTNSNGREFSMRNSFVGLKGAWGIAKAGKNDTPFKDSQAKVDLFNDLYGDMKVILAGEIRGDNYVGYETRRWNGLTAKVASFLAEDQTQTGTGATNDAYSGALSWENKMVYVAAAMDSKVKDTIVSNKITGATSSKETDSIRLVGQLKLGDAQLGALWQQTESSDGKIDSEDGYLVSAAYTIDRTTLKAEYGKSDQKLLGGELMSIGVDYKLAKNTTALAFYTDVSSDIRKDEKSAFGVGLEHKF